jgi:hypothetical protein
MCIHFSELSKFISSFYSLFIADFLVTSCFNVVTDVLLDMTYRMHVRGGITSNKVVVASVLWVGERDDDAV